jgi:hypothetical protein
MYYLYSVLVIRIKKNIDIFTIESEYKTNFKIT